ALLFSGSHDCVTPPADHQIPMYQALAADCRALVSLTGGSHCQFAEQSTICELGEGGCTPPSISRGEQHALTLQLLLPWLRHTLKQAPGAWGEFQALLEGLGGITFLLDCAPAAMVFDPTSPGRPGATAPRLQAELWPNPAAGPVEIRFRLAGEERLTVDVWSVGGRRVRTLLDGRVAEGAQRLVWDGLDGQARRVPAGLYWVRVRTPRDSDARPLLKIR
ncbi:MAG: hypothetical protein FJY75_09830, partial [Candidatus Eisenbacteria bacterium]|nr:hypothetical protein [Candidatus Eisenbacteria bacterium]